MLGYILRWAGFEPYLKRASFCAVWKPETLTLFYCCNDFANACASWYRKSKWDHGTRGVNKSDIALTCIARGRDDRRSTQSAKWKGSAKGPSSIRCSKCWCTGTGTINFYSALFYGMSYPKTYLKWSEVPESNEKIRKPMQKWIVLHFQTKSGKLKHSKQLQKIGVYIATAQKHSAMQSYYFNSLIHSL